MDYTNPMAFSIVHRPLPVTLLSIIAFMGVIGTLLLYPVIYALSVLSRDLWSGLTISGIFCALLMITGICLWSMRKIGVYLFSFLTLLMNWFIISSIVNRFLHQQYFSRVTVDELIAPALFLFLSIFCSSYLFSMRKLFH